MGRWCNYFSSGTINTEILNVNSYEKKINFKIYKDDFPNAYVTEENIIYISSGLLTYSPNYVSLLGVLAHEIGHIEKYHVAKRKKEIKNLKNISSYGNLATVVGSMIIQEPSVLNAIIVKLRTGKQIVTKDLNLDKQLFDKINKFAPIKYILKNKSDNDNQVIELLEDISRDLINYDLEFRIQELESKLSKDMSETTFNELKELKKKQNVN